MEQDMTIEAKIGLLEKAVSRLKGSYDVVKVQEQTTIFEEKLSEGLTTDQGEFRLYSDRQSQIEEYQDLAGRAQEALIYASQAKALDDRGFLDDAENDIDEVVGDIRAFVLTQKVGNYDDNSANCIISLAPGESGKYMPDVIRDFAGAYSKFARKTGFEVEEVSFDDDLSPSFLVSATKEAPSPYGTFRGEDGVHKFIVPDNNGRPQTKFLGIKVEKQEPNDELVIARGELKYEFIGSSGPGGQHVNKNATSVRVTYESLGVQVTVRGRHRAHNIKSANWKIRQKIKELQRQEAPVSERQIIQAGHSFRLYDLRSGLINDKNSGIKSNTLDDFFKGNLEPFINGFYGIDF